MDNQVSVKWEWVHLTGAPQNPIRGTFPSSLCLVRLIAENTYPSSLSTSTGSFNLLKRIYPHVLKTRVQECHYLEVIWGLKFVREVRALQKWT